MAKYAQQRTAIYSKISPTRSYRKKRWPRWFEFLEDRRLLAVITVDTTVDSFVSEQTSLRQAIELANDNGEPDEIIFDILDEQGFVDIDSGLNVDGADSGPDVYLFQFARPLPPLTEDGTFINGGSQTSIADTNPNGPEIVLSGAFTDVDIGSGNHPGLTVESSQNQISGLVLQGFGMESTDAAIRLEGASQNTIADNFIGTDATGTLVEPNSTGIRLTGASDNIVEGNVIAGNVGAGIELVGSDRNLISRNLIGSGVDEQTAIPNGGDGIVVDESMSNTVGGSEPNSANVIAFNGGNGVLVRSTDSGIGNVIQANRIFANDGLGIELTPIDGLPDGVTPNDSDDLDSGGNDLVNFPDITLAVAGTNVRVVGSLSSRPLSSFGLEFYANADGEADLSGHGEAARVLGRIDVTTDELGSASFDSSLNASAAVGELISATATDAEFGTSEFATNVAAIDLPEISGTVFDDLGGNGPTADDLPRSGATIQLFRDDGDVQFDPTMDELVDTAVSDDGAYAFTELLPGTYFVRYLEDADILTAGGDDFPSVPQYLIELPAGVTDAENDFHSFTPIGISGGVLVDILATGIASDLGIRNVPLELLLDDGDGLLSAEDIVVATTDSGEDGRYIFEEVGPGDYFVTVALPDRYNVIGADNRFLSAVSGVDSMDIDFLGFEPPDISGRKFDDLTGDGFSAGDDTPLAGFTIQLFADDGDGVFDRDTDSLIEEQVTSVNGAYRFTMVQPNIIDAEAAPYFVVEQLNSDSIQTDGGTDPHDHYVVTPNSGIDRAAFDFANFRVGSISGASFQDRTGDGVTPDDLLLEGTTINLFVDDGDGLLTTIDSLVGSQQTLADGTYSFVDLTPGRFFVQQEVPDGFVATFDGPNGLHEVVMTSGTEFAEVDFAVAQFARISGNVFDDANRDKIRDGAELALEDWDVHLLNSSGELVATGVTDDAGNYEFFELFPGEYTVSLVLEPGWEPTSPLGRLEANRPIGTGETPDHGNIAGFVQSADLNGDGAIDLIVANEFLYSVERTGSISLLLNDGFGGFTEPLDNTDCSLEAGASCQIHLPVNTRAQSVELYDLEGDGDLDLVVSAAGKLDTEATADSLLVIENLGGGLFGDPRVIRSVGSPLATAVGDVTGDGMMDIVVAGLRVGEVALLVNEGSGLFGTPNVLYQASEPVDVELADLNGDHELDVIIADHGADGVAILLSDLGEFGNAQFMTGIGGAAATAVEDFNGDGFADLAIAEYDADRVSVWHGDGTGSFLRGTFFTVGQHPRSITAADINGDRAADIVVANSSDGSISLLINVDDGFADHFSFAMDSVNSAAGISPQNVLLVDVDNDGDADAVTSHYVGGVAVSENRLGVYDVTVDYESVVTGRDFGNSLVDATANSASRGAVLSSKPMLNEHLAMDVDNNGQITPRDVLLIVNELNQNGAGNVAEMDFSGDFFYLDVSGDNVVTPRDALLVINYLNEMRRQLASAIVAEAQSSEAPEHDDDRTESTVELAEPMRIAPWLTPPLIVGSNPTAPMESYGDIDGSPGTRTEIIDAVDEVFADFGG